MSAPHQKPVHDHAPGRGEETPLPDLEDDETIAPRPEEEIADLFREGPVAKGSGDAGE
ncbi:hypothetical protein [Brachybacterium nesterenkovii]|uniref:Uncharacterized protein n=1 Tax=Brachybacterium nesterenkovii TaxID=47847 RepID=A0A1X6WWR1_9MICO|nr:hypothetical protein [Brachybacterium nesterenkovii]SLM90105.1 hypothetical protein FM110_04520 [Brachybacterium nesterenkovii]